MVWYGGGGPLPVCHLTPSSRRAGMGLPGGGSLLRKAPTPYSALRPSKTHYSRLPSLSQSFLTVCPRARPSPLCHAARPWGLLPGLGADIGTRSRS